MNKPETKEWFEGEISMATMQIEKDILFIRANSGFTSVSFSNGTLHERTVALSTRDWKALAQLILETIERTRSQP